MTRIAFSLIVLFAAGMKPYAQSDLDQHDSIEQMYDLLMNDWLKVSERLKTYEGLSEFCAQPDFRDYTTHLLAQLHHYDSLLIDLLENNEDSLDGSHREHMKTLKEIQKFETKYSMRGFLVHLRENCIARNEIEKSKKDTQYASGMYSYDGQVAVVEADIHTFLKHIDKRVISIDEHIHRIHPDHALAIRQNRKEPLWIGTN